MKDLINIEIKTKQKQKFAFGIRTGIELLSILRNALFPRNLEFNHSFY